MGNAPESVLVTKFKATGGCYARPYVAGAPQPKDASTPLPAGYVNLGYIGPDGLSRTIDKDTHEVLAAGGVLVKTVTKGTTVTYEFALMQSDLPALTEVFGPENVTMSPEGVLDIAHGAKDMPVRNWAWELADGVNSLREVCERGQVTAVSNVTFGTGEETIYTITVTALTDAEGNKAHTYQEKGDGPEA
jgi:hypothetical protein